MRATLAALDLFTALRNVLPGIALERGPPPSAALSPGLFATADALERVRRGHAVPRRLPRRRGVRRRPDRRLTPPTRSRRTSRPARRATSRPARSATPSPRHAPGSRRSHYWTGERRSTTSNRTAPTSSSPTPTPAHTLGASKTCRSSTSAPTVANIRLPARTARP